MLEAWGPSKQPGSNQKLQAIIISSPQMVRVHTHTRTHRHTHIYSHIHAHIHTRTDTHVLMHTYTIYTYTRTQGSWPGTTQGYVAVSVLARFWCEGLDWSKRGGTWSGPAQMGGSVIWRRQPQGRSDWVIAIMRDAVYNLGHGTTILRVVYWRMDTAWVGLARTVYIHRIWPYIW
jgi:acid stress-induced BolA-like protein IbaG/YrbA